MLTRAAVPVYPNADALLKVRLPQVKKGCTRTVPIGNPVIRPYHLVEVRSEIFVTAQELREVETDLSFLPLGPQCHVPDEQRSLESSRLLVPSSRDTTLQIITTNF